MKTTIKLTKSSHLTIEPGGQGVRLGLHGLQETVAVLDLTPDQIGALIFALEVAEEAAQIAAAREKLAGAVQRATA
jgi:hypothetical protein